MHLHLEEKLGDGGFADVWRATDELDRFVAVKIVRHAGMGIASALDHAKALARTNHPNVVSVYSIDKVVDPITGELMDCVVMELIAGETLTSKLSGDKFTVGEARQIGESIITGISHIHEQGMAHGDLHTDNIMVSTEVVKVIDILYLDSLSILSSGSKEARLQRDIVSLRLLLQQIIMHSELNASEATEFNNLLESNATLGDLLDAFLKITDPATLSDVDRLVEHAFSYLVDEGFDEGAAYAAALADETQDDVILPLLTKVVDEKVYEHKHKKYLQALWSRMVDSDKISLLNSLGQKIDQEVPSGRFWPLTRMLSSLRREGWELLNVRTRLRLENLITRDVLAGHLDIHSVKKVSGGSLGTYALSLWEHFDNLDNLADNLISLLHQNWYTQNYVGEYFMTILPDIAEAAGKTDETIEALKSAVRNDARIIVNELEELPADWVSKIKG